MKKKTYIYLGIVFALVGATRLIVGYFDESVSSTQNWLIAWFWLIEGIAYILKGIVMGKKERNNSPAPSL
jgi:uncharacterized membrane protein HdeD (DUF308 family)